MAAKAKPVHSADSDDEDRFEDAEDKPTASAVISKSTVTGSDVINDNISSMLNDVTRGMDLYINNHFDEAKALFLKHSETSIYHALGHATVMFIQAILTFEPDDIDLAIEAVRKSTHVCSERRRKQESFVGSMVTKKGKSYYSEFTPLELHAELCYAECLVERALLTFLQDETLKGFIEGALKVKACYDSYKQCLKIYKKRQWDAAGRKTPGSSSGQGSEEREQFGCGIALGVGVFTLLLASLPAKILKLLEYIGFTGDKASGIYELECAAALQNTVHGPLSALALVAYHSLITHWFGSGEGDIDKATQLLKGLAPRYKQGAIFLFLEGRIEAVRGRLDDAIIKYEESIASQNQWKQFHHLCYWELMWCYAYTGDWLLAMKYAERMYEESNWSRSVCAYLKACFLIMIDNPSAETKDHIAQLLHEVPKQKQTRAGKSIPVEKFAIRKAERYFEQKGRLTLAAYELMYLWTGCIILGTRKDLPDPLIAMATQCMDALYKNRSTIPHYQDDYAMAAFLKGVALRLKGDQVKALASFNEVLSLDKDLKEDTHLLPCTLYEMALMELDNNKPDKAKKLIDSAKNNYKKYSLESRIHFRLNAVESRLKPPSSAKPTSAVFDAKPKK